MPELLRPLPARGWRERFAERVQALAARARPARLATAAIAVVVVGVAAWWLLRSPAAAVEDRLPRATSARTTAVSAAARAPSSSAAASAAATGAADAGTVLVVQAAGSVACRHLPVGCRCPGRRSRHRRRRAVAGRRPRRCRPRGQAGRRAARDVPAQGEVAAAAAAGDATSDPGTPAVTTVGPTPDTPLDLNVATVAQLDQLPGVGPSTAAAIIAYRDKHGPFHAVEELLDVRGIGTAKLDAIRDLVRV